MPTTKQEAKRIVEIFDEYLTEEQAKEITNKLYDQVAMDSENTSLVVSLEMLRALYHPDHKKRFVRHLIFWRTMLYLIVTIHFTVLLFNFIAFFLLPFFVEWYIALPIMSLLVNFAWGTSPCPLTRTEDWIRHKLGMPKVKLFIGYYIVWPLREKLKRRELNK